MAEVDLSHPDLRADLHLAPAFDREGACTYVRDPVTHRFFRLGTTARLVVDRMDGSRSVADIAVEVSTQVGVELPAAAVDRLVGQLARLGFLANGPPSPAPPKVRGGLFFFLVPLVDPDRALDRLRPVVRAMTSRLIVVTMGGLILGGIVVSLAVMVGYPALDPGPVGWRELLFFYLVVSLALVGHELAHAFALKRFGGEVHELGLLFLYFQPCLFCNVSDAYLLPRGQRLWVSFAGIYFELAAWGVASVLAFGLGSATLPGRVAAMIAAVIGLKAVLFNLNPLIKLDGYYLLVDLLGMPNLRARAFEHLKSTLRGRSTAFAARREHPILIAYAVMSGAFLILLFTGILVRLARLEPGAELDLPTLFLVVVGLFLLIRGLRGLYGMLMDKPQRGGAEP